AAETGANPVVPPQKQGSGVQTAPAEGAEDAGEDKDTEETARDSAREHFRQGAHVLRNSLQESVSDLQDSVSESVSNLHERLQRHRPEAVGQLLTSIRESTDTLGLTSSGKHRGGTRLPVVIGVGLGVLALLAVGLGALLCRWPREGRRSAGPGRAGGAAGRGRAGERRRRRRRPAACAFVVCPVVGPAGFEPALDRPYNGCLCRLGYGPVRG